MALSQLKPALQYSEGRSKPWSGSALLNAFCEKADGDKQTDFAVMAVPGLDLFGTLPEGPVRGLHVMDSVLYAVAGYSLYSVADDGTSTLLGPVNGTGPVRMVDNGSQLAIAASDQVGRVYADGTVQTPLPYPAIDVAYIDGYFFWASATAGQGFYSSPTDGLSYSADDVVAAEGSPDGLVGIINDHRELHLFGTDTDEIFYNAGDPDNPFQRQGNAFIERGCFDRASIVKVDNSVHFFGEDRIVYRLDGYTPMRISTHAIEYRLSTATYARAFAYTQEGHKFYVLNSDQGTFAYDMATGTWHERQSYGRDSYRAHCAVRYNDAMVFGDAEDGRLYRPNLASYNEDGDPIRVRIDLPTLEASRARVTMYAFELYCETGVGLNDGQGSDPQAMLEYSDDGGRRWSNELWRSLGRIGEYRTRAIWRSLGQFRSRQMRLTITDPVRRLVMGYFADVR